MCYEKVRKITFWPSVFGEYFISYQCIQIGKDLLGMEDKMLSFNPLPTQRWRKVDGEDGFVGGFLL